MPHGKSLFLSKSALLCQSVVAARGGLLHMLSGWTMDVDTWCGWIIVRLFKRDNGVIGSGLVALRRSSMGGFHGGSKVPRVFGLWWENEDDGHTSSYYWSDSDCLAHCWKRECICKKYGCIQLLVYFFSKFTNFSLILLQLGTFNSTPLMN